MQEVESRSLFVQIPTEQPFFCIKIEKRDLRFIALFVFEF